MKNRSGTPAVPVGSVPYVLFRRAAPFAVVAALSCVVVAGVVGGRHGAVGATIGALIVAAFYGLDLLTLRTAESLPGNALLPLMLLQYLIKVVVLGIVMARLWDSDAFSVEAMGITVAIAVVVWTASLTVMAARINTYSVDAVEKAESPDKSAGS